MASTAKNFIASLPVIGPIVLLARTIYRIFANRSLRTILYAPPGHFYSPLPNLKAVREASRDPLDAAAQTPGIDLRDVEQLALLEKFASFYAELPFTGQPTHDSRYYYENPFFGYGDAIVLYSMIRHYKPRRIVEVGSGFSSAVMLDTVERFFDEPANITFVEPYPARLDSVLKPVDRTHCTVVAAPVQDVDARLFTQLSAGDFLFVDSSHVAKVGSDVNHLLFDVLPSLQPGVVVHFHDVYWPFDYPKPWILAGRAWNEAYALRAFLQYNSAFQILYFNAYIAARHRERLVQTLPLCMNDPGASLWLTRTA